MIKNSEKTTPKNRKKRFAPLKHMAGSYQLSNEFGLNDKFSSRMFECFEKKIEFAFRVSIQPSVHSLHLIYIRNNEKNRNEKCISSFSRRQINMFLSVVLFSYNFMDISR